MRRRGLQEVPAELLADKGIYGAVCRNEVSKIEALIKDEPEWLRKEKKCEGFTIPNPLFCAAHYKGIEYKTYTTLLEMGADLLGKEGGENILFGLIRNANYFLIPPTITALKNKGEDIAVYINKRNAEGDTILHEAAYTIDKDNLNIEAAWMLLKNGVDPMLVNNEGNTPLLAHAKFCQQFFWGNQALLKNIIKDSAIYYMRLLALKGCDPEARNRLGESLSTINLLTPEQLEKVRKYYALYKQGQQNHTPIEIPPTDFAEAIQTKRSSKEKCRVM